MGQAHLSAVKNRLIPLWKETGRTDFKTALPAESGYLEFNVKIMAKQHMCFPIILTKEHWFATNRNKRSKGTKVFLPLLERLIMSA